MNQKIEETADDKELFMLTRFLAIRSKEIGSKLYFNVCSVSNNAAKNGISEAQLALNFVDSLCQQKKYTEALREIVKIEENHPEGAKATKYYREKIYENRLGEDGKKKKFSPSI